jgi:cobalamin biosynthesis protein CobD/CbiB
MIKVRPLPKTWKQVYTHIMKEFDKVIAWLNKNSDKIFTVTGKLALLIGVIALIVWLIAAGIRSLAGISGFQFDPFMLIAVVGLGSLFLAQTRRMNSQIKEIKDLQEQIIAKERSLVIAEPKKITKKKASGK